MKISQVERYLIMISNVKYINGHFLLVKVTFEMGKGLWVFCGSPPISSIYMVAD